MSASKTSRRSITRHRWQFATEPNRLTLYERSDTTGETAFRYSEQNGVGLFYWSDQDFGYALAAKADRQKLLQLAEIVYHQLSGDSPKTKFPPPPVPPGKAS